MSLVKCELDTYETKEYLGKHKPVNFCYLIKMEVDYIFALRKFTMYMNL